MTSRGVAVGIVVGIVKGSWSGHVPEASWYLVDREVLQCRSEMVRHGAGEVIDSDDANASALIGIIARVGTL